MADKKNCIRCNSSRLAYVAEMLKDDEVVAIYLYNVAKWVNSTSGETGIGYNSWVEFTYCLECGQIQGDFPIPKLKGE